MEALLRYNMTYLFDANGVIPTNGTEVVYRLKTLLKIAGWTVKSSSDGTTFDSSTDIITGFSSGSNGLGNTSAWFRITDAANGRELCFQRGTTNIAWRIKYSATSKFTSGGNATTMSTATDEQYILGTSGATASWMNTDNTYRWNAGADGYSFWSAGLPMNKTTSQNFSAVMFLDKLVDGSYNVLDEDPAIIYARGPTTVAFAASSITSDSSSSAPQGWILKGFTGAGFVPINPLKYQYVSSIVIPNNAGVDPFSGAEYNFDVAYGRAFHNTNGITPPSGFKGMSSLIKWNGTLKLNYQVLSINGARDRICFGDLNFPWNGSVPVT